MVSWTACSSLCTVSLSLLTAALADARLASRVAELTLELGEDELEPVSLVPVEPLLGDLVVGAVVVVVRVPLGVVVAGVVVVGVLPGAVVVGVLGEVVVCVLGELLVGGALVRPVAAVAVSEAAVRRTEAVEAAPEPAPEPVELCPVEVSPLVSSSLARLASAAWRVAFACSRVTSALCGSKVASSWPWTTCSPWVT